MSFLDKLKRKVDVLEEGKLKEAEGGEPKKDLMSSGTSYAQLDVDIYETPEKYIILGSIAGVDIKNLELSVGEENDVLIIQGKKETPIEQLKAGESKIVPHHQECQWGEFYRQIILPQEINPEMIEAYEEKGVLVIILPMLRLQRGKKNIQVSLKA